MTGRQRPDMPDHGVAEVYDWLAANGVDEWIPENPQFRVVGGTLTYTAWVWNVDADGRSLRGWDTAHVTLAGDALAVEQRTVPLMSPVTDQVRELFAELGLRLVEGDDQ